MKADVRVYQLRTNEGRAYVNVDTPEDDHGQSLDGISLSSSTYQTVAYFLPDGEHFWHVVTFNNQDWANEWLPRNPEAVPMADVLAVVKTLRKEQE